MAMQSNSSFSFSYEFYYDVFISFRGTDTRFGFTGNLYKALSDNGIRTFIDDKELQRGDEITSSLLKNIEDSRIAIVVFSPNYATSSFCLDELVHIIHYFKEESRLVLPVFYGTEPSQVRQQNDRYGEALAVYEKSFRNNKEKMERLQKWKRALNQAANLSGYHFRKEEYEYEFIKKIVTDISNKLNRVLLNVANHPVVGLESRPLQPKSLLDVDCDNGVSMIGTYESGGLGKTFTQAIYDFLPALGRRKAQQDECFNWTGTRGVNKEIVIKNLPEDLKRDIRRHWFKFVKKVRIFSLMNEPILDAIYERLRQKLYIKGSKVLYYGDLVENVVFIVRGKLESIGEDGFRVPLSEGHVCGRELLTRYLEHTSGNKVCGKTRIPRQRLISNRTVLCLTNVEAFSIRAADLEEVTKLFARFLRSPGVQGAIRFESPYWRCLAATRIQVAWRHRMKRLYRANTSHLQSNNESPYWRCLAATRIQVAWRHRMKRLYRANTLHLQSNNESPYWRCLAATRIQVAWRHRMKRLHRANTLHLQSNNEASFF